MTAVGFIGLGQIGAPMAGHLVGWPDGLIVCDVRADATAPFAERGAEVAAAPADVAARASLISVMVRDDAQVREVVHGILERAAAGTVIAIHSTIAPGTAEELETRAGVREVALIDAPVSGGFIGAANANLAVMAGGTAEAVDRCREMFARWASLVVHVGPAGAGTRAKLARNLLQFAGFAAALESQRLAEAAGIDLGTLAKVVRHSDAVTGGPGAIMMRDTTGPLTDDSPLYEVLSHTRELGEKDLRLALDLATQLGVDLPFAKLALQRFGPGLGLP